MARKKRVRLPAYKPTKLTAFKVANIKPHPDGERVEIADKGKPGLFLGISPSGRKSWGIRYRFQGKPRHLTLDGFPSLAVAHKLASDALDAVAQGGDPAREKQEAKRRAPVVDDIADALVLFLDKHTITRSGKPIRASTKYETARLLGLRRDADDTKWVETGNGILRRWRGRNLTDIKAHDVRDLLDDLHVTPVVANRTLSALKTFFSFHQQRDPDLLPSSPCASLRKPAPETSRDRVLSDAEVTALWRVSEAEGYPFGPLVQLLLLSGCRRDEAREATWGEFDLERREWLIPAARTKNGRDHVVPLTDAMLSILEKLPRIGNRRLLFTMNGATAPVDMFKRRLRLHAAMTKELGEEPPPWTLHDLRRTFASGLQRLSIKQEVTEACLNHRSGLISGVAAVYARHDFAAEKRAALDAWASHVKRLVEGVPSGAVVPLRRTARAGA